MANRREPYTHTVPFVVWSRLPAHTNIGCPISCSSSSCVLKLQLSKLVCGVLLSSRLIRCCGVSLPQCMRVRHHLRKLRIGAVELGSRYSHSPQPIGNPPSSHRPSQTPLNLWEPARTAPMTYTSQRFVLQTRPAKRQCEASINVSIRPGTSSECRP